MNLVKQGMGLKSIKSFENVIPRDLVRNFFAVGDRVLMRMHGYDLLIGVKAILSQDDKQLSIEGFDLPRNMDIKNDEDILLIQSIVVV